VKRHFEELLKKTRLQRKPVDSYDGAQRTDAQRESGKERKFSIDGVISSINATFGNLKTKHLSHHTVRGEKKKE